MSLYDKASLVQIPSGYKASDAKLYSVLPANGNGDFTVSVDADATRVNKDGLIESVAANQARLDYPLIDGVVQDCPVLLLEPSRANSFTYSESLNSGWTTGGATMTLTASQFTSPDGSQNASRLQIPSSASASLFYQLLSHTAGTQYTISMYAKSNTGTNQSFRLYGDFGAGGNISSSFSATNEWQRFTYTFTATGTGSRSAGIYNTLNEAADLQIYGIQFETGYLTSYIPTSASAVTRTADTCNGAGDSSTFNDSEGVLFVEFAALTNDLTHRRIAISDGTTSNLVYISFDTASNRILANANGKILLYTVSDETEFQKVAVYYNTTAPKLYVNGVLRETETAMTAITGLNELAFDGGTGSNNFYGKVKQVMVFNTALSDSELQTLTT